MAGEKLYAEMTRRGNKKTGAAYVESAINLVTDGSGTITIGGVSQVSLVANANRKGFLIQNNSNAELWFNTLATATGGQPSLKLIANASYETPIGGLGTGPLSIYGATAGQQFSVREW